MCNAYASHGTAWPQNVFTLAVAINLLAHESGMLWPASCSIIDVWESPLLPVPSTVFICFATCIGRQNPHKPHQTLLEIRHNPPGWSPKPSTVQLSVVQISSHIHLSAKSSTSTTSMCPQDPPLQLAHLAACARPRLRCRIPSWGPNGVPRGGQGLVHVWGAYQRMLQGGTETITCVDLQQSSVFHTKMIYSQ